jgi:hypothetical protein
VDSITNSSVVRKPNLEAVDLLHSSLRLRPLLWALISQDLRSPNTVVLTGTLSTDP